MKLTPYTSDKACEIADLFVQAVHAIDPVFYSKAQKAAWAPLPVDYDFWTSRLAIKKPFLAMLGGRVAGFVELDEGGHIDCLYVHPQYQRQGVASDLYRYLESVAISRRIHRLTVEASRVAQPFFEAWGFTVIRENHLQRQGVTLVNVSMEKMLQVPQDS